MIYIGKHSKKFENEFCNIALEELDEHVNVNEFVNECKKIIPITIIDTDDTEDFLKQLILLPYCRIEEIYNYISNGTNVDYNNIVFENNNLRDVFADYHDCYENVRDHKYNNKKISVALTEDLNLTVCPYCNRDYIMVGQMIIPDANWIISFVEVNIHSFQYHFIIWCHHVVCVII